MPTMKLIEKLREAAKVRKRHDTARTPYERVLACPDVDPEVKAALQTRVKQLDPAALRRPISNLSDDPQAPCDPHPPDPTTLPGLQDSAGLRKAGPQPSAPTFPQPLENPPPPPPPGFPHRPQPPRLTHPLRLSDKFSMRQRLFFRIASSVRQQGSVAQGALITAPRENPDNRREIPQASVGARP